MFLSPPSPPLEPRFPRVRRNALESDLSLWSPSLGLCLAPAWLRVRGSPLGSGCLSNSEPGRAGLWAEERVARPGAGAGRSWAG